MLSLKRREFLKSSILQVQIEEKVVEIEETENLSAPTRNSRQIKTRSKANIFTPYIKNLGHPFLIRAHNLDFSAEK